MVLDLIVNPIAGRRHGMETAARARTLFYREGMTIREHVSEYPRHAVELAAAAIRREPASQGIIAVGGDGTLFETLNGVLDAAAPVDAEGHADRSPFQMPLGIVPVGTGNSFIRDLGINDVDGAVAAILGGKTRSVDLGLLRCDADEHAFINLLGAGFVSNVAHRAQFYKRFGALSYVLAVIHETIALKSDRLVLTIDGERIEREALFLEICNSRYTGGAMMMAPTAEIDDGLFDIVVMSRCSRHKLLSLFPRIFSGTHVTDPLIEVFRGVSVRAETTRSWLLTPDGETFGSTPISVTMRPRAVEMFIP